MEPGTTGYALLDAGDGRRLERFGAFVLDRPAPGAGTPRRDPGAWVRASARFDRERGSGGGTWSPPGALPEHWVVELEGLRLELRPTASGQVGVFPEHVGVARWAAARARACGESLGRPAVVLNLFAHTGLVTLAVARAGAAVVHVDASRPAVTWARRNAVHAGLEAAAIRWLVDDAARFVEREARRGHRYDGIVLDPPTYGHGPGGAPWRFHEDLGALLAAARTILADGPWFAACTAHATGLPADALARVVGDALGVDPARVAGRDVSLASAGGAILPAGCVVLAEADPERPGGGAGEAMS